jgi:hypothetical protein
MGKTQLKKNKKNPAKFLGGYTTFLEATQVKEWE